jgi:hypothetical protein
MLIFCLLALTAYTYAQDETTGLKTGDGWTIYSFKFTHREGVQSDTVKLIEENGHDIFKNALMKLNEKSPRPFRITIDPEEEAFLVHGIDRVEKVEDLPEEKKQKIREHKAEYIVIPFFWGVGGMVTAIAKSLHRQDGSLIASPETSFPYDKWESGLRDLARELAEQIYKDAGEEIPTWLRKRKIGFGKFENKVKKTDVKYAEYEEYAEFCPYMVESELTNLLQGNVNFNIKDAKIGLDFIISGSLIKFGNIVYVVFHISDSDHNRKKSVEEQIESFDDFGDELKKITDRLSKSLEELTKNR